MDQLQISEEEKGILFLGVPTIMFGAGAFTLPGLGPKLLCGAVALLCGVLTALRIRQRFKQSSKEVTFHGDKGTDTHL